MTDTISLSGPEQGPASGNKAKQLVVLLHGLGADGFDLFALAPHFAEVMPDAHFVAPHAPFECDMAPFGFQWFSLMDRSEEKVYAGVSEAAPILGHYLDVKLEELGLGNEDCYLIGFSQGSMLSMHLGLRREPQMGGILAYSGALVAPQRLDDEIKAKPPICLIHGEADEVVPFMAFEQALNTLKKMEVPVEGYSQQGLGHGIDPAGMEIGRKFLVA